MKDTLKKVKKPAKLLKNKKKKLREPQKEVKMQEMSVDDFMSEFITQETNEGNVDVSTLPLKEKCGLIKKKKKNLKAFKSNSKNFETNIGKRNFESEVMCQSSDEEEDHGDCDISDDEFKSHKKQLDSLKTSDPDFYKYLEENDQELLNFDDSDPESDADSGVNEKFHKVPDKLEVASDESDYEVDEEVQKKRKGGNNCITTKMVTEWQKGLSKGNISALREVSWAFHAAVVSVSPEEDATSPYVVEGAVVFNSVIRLCVVQFLPAIHKALRIPISFKLHPKTSKNWNKIKHILRSYFTDLAELSRVTSPDMLAVLLKHIHQLCPLLACFPSIAPKFLRRVVQLWATDEDVVRVLAFLCALRLGQLRPSLLRQALKIMLMTYVRNTKFVSPSTLPGINFMRQSLCEMFALDNTVSYHMAFLYIRQAAIHLRNAITLKKKDSYKTVYNWAYMATLHLWADLLGLVHRDSPLGSLAYPLVQIIIGTIKLIPSAQFFPLRFHCLRLLMSVAAKCNLFVPVLPFLLEVLADFNFNREHKKLSMKPMDLTCLLRCSKSQMKENGFKDALIDNVQNLMVEYLATECHRLSFPDITVPCVIEMKKFLKTCNVANYNKKIKAILDKLTENSKFIEEERKKLSLKLDDQGGIAAAEAAILAKHPPFLRFHENWTKVHLQQQARKVTSNHKLGDFKLPVLYKLEKKRTRVDTKPLGPAELFPSDDEGSECEKILTNNKNDKDVSNDDDEEEEEPPRKRNRREKKQAADKNKVQRVAEENKNYEDDDDDDFEDEGDIIQDLKYSDFV